MESTIFVRTNKYINFVSDKLNFQRHHSFSKFEADFDIHIPRVTFAIRILDSKDYV